MNDRYLYRAKRTDNGEWIIGSLIQADYIGTVRSWISSEQYDKARLREISSNQAVWRAFEVRNDTICQCTGLNDNNGKLIFENDIVELHDKNIDFTWRAILSFGNPGEYTWGWRLEPLGECKANEDILCWIDMEESGAFCEVIGNIFDNPELLESKGCD